MYDIGFLFFYYPGWPFFFIVDFFFYDIIMTVPSVDMIMIVCSLGAIPNYHCFTYFVTWTCARLCTRYRVNSGLQSANHRKKRRRTEIHSYFMIQSNQSRAVGRMCFSCCHDLIYAVLWTECVCLLIWCFYILCDVNVRILRTVHEEEENTGLLTAVIHFC